MPRAYRYVGPRDLLVLLTHPVARVQVTSSDSIRNWIATTKQEPGPDGLIPTTFVVDCDGRLWIADQRLEHVVCARGGEVVAAGELLVRPDGAVAGATNQSTGYCPEPDSWKALADALDRARLGHPAAWTSVYTFRRCPTCGMINLVKDDWFVCAVCDADLPSRWNF